MRKIKYNGHPGIGPVYHAATYNLAEGQTLEVSDEEAERVVAQYGEDAFEIVGEKARKADGPVTDHVTATPKRKRGKSHAPKED